MVGIVDWNAKRAFLRAVYDASNDKALVLEIATPQKGERTYDALLLIYDTFRRWGSSKPSGPDQVAFWQWIVDQNCVAAKPLELWACSIVEFIEKFDTSENDVPLAVSQMLADDRADLRDESRAQLVAKYVRAGALDNLFQDFSIAVSESTVFEGPHTGIRKGGINHAQFYATPEAAEAWTALIETGSYRMYLDCLLSLKAMMASSNWASLMATGRYDAIVALGGGGSPEKEWVIAKSLANARQRAFDLVLTDISFYMISDSARALSRRIRKDGLGAAIKAYYCICDFMRLDEQLRRKSSWSAVVWTLLGGAMGNIAKERDFFRSLRGPSRVGDLLILGIDTCDGESEEQLEQRMNAHYRSKEVDAFLLHPVEHLVAGASPAVEVKVTTGRRGGYSEMEKSRTVVFATSLQRNGQAQDTVLTTSTRYDAQELVEFASRQGWGYLCATLADKGSTFRQLLFQRTE